MDKLNYRKAGIVFIVGIVGIYIMNILRIVLIMIVGLTKPEMTLGVFHSQAGWILFSAFVLGLYAVSQKWMLKDSLINKLKNKKIRFGKDRSTKKKPVTKKINRISKISKTKNTNSLKMSSKFRNKKIKKITK